MSLKQKYPPLRKILVIAFLAFLLITSLSSLQKVTAATLTNMWAVESNMDASGSGQLWLAFEAGSSGSPGTISINLSGSGASVASSNANLDPLTTGCTSTFSFLSGITALPGTLTASGSGSTISLSGATSLTANTNYCLVFAGTSAITNPSAAGVYSYTVSDTQDSGTGDYSVLSSGANNTISVTATVPQAFTLALSGNSDPLGNLSASNVTTSSGVEATVSTNAPNGLGLWAYDTNAGLHSTTASHTISSTDPGATVLQTLASGTEGYVTNAAYVSEVAGTAPTTTVPFTGASGTGDGLNSTPSELASGSGPVDGAEIDVKESAAISPITPAASDYSDSITIVCAGSF